MLLGKVFANIPSIMLLVFAIEESSKYRVK
jgi:hypothetical protein